MLFESPADPAPRKGCPSGISGWGSGGDSFGRSRGDAVGVSGRGGDPLKGFSLPPPSLSEGGVSVLGGRAPVIHEFLDAAECRVSGMILGKKFRSRRKDVLRDFREVVLFLVLAGYSPNFVRTFFLRRFPNLFPVLSYKGAETSVVLSVKEAWEGSLRVKGEFLDLLKKYVAGPWVHDAPDWLREQYGVLGCNVECSGMDSGKDSVGDAEAVKVPAEVPAVTGDFGEDLSPGHSESAMGISPGLSIWALGQFPKLGETGGFYGEGRRVGPYRGLSKMPPSISMDREGEREPGSRGRLSVRHPFLDVAGCWIRPYRKKKRVSPVCWDRLRNFRSVVWFLVLAGYSPSYIQTFFLTEILRAAI